jgi:hypothetical protein
MAAAQAQGRASQPPDTWYDFVLKQFNPNNLDYSRWMEERRRAFLEATVSNPYFSYGFWLTLWSLLVMSAYAKLWIDRRRERFVTEFYIVRVKKKAHCHHRILSLHFWVRSKTP